MDTTATAVRTEKRPSKRKKVQDSATPPKIPKHASSGHAPTGAISGSSSPIIVASTRKTVDNSSIMSMASILLPPIWSSDEDNELASDHCETADTDDDDLDERQQSSQLTEKEKKAVAKKRLKKAREDKRERLPYCSPVHNFETDVSKNTRKSKSKACNSEEFDELATQIPGSNSDALAPMPWESDAEEDSASRESSLCKLFDDLPPPLPQPEKVWLRKARPPSRKDLFDASQRPAVRLAFPARSREESEELPELTLSTSSNTKYDQLSSPDSGAVKAKPTPAAVSYETQTPNRLLRNSSLEAPREPQRSSSVKMPERAEYTIAVPLEEIVRQSPKKNDQLPAHEPEETLYWEDNSFMESAFSINEGDLHMANLRPFFTPSPPGKAHVQLPMPEPATLEMDMLIAAAEEEAENAPDSKSPPANSAPAPSPTPDAFDPAKTTTPKTSNPPKLARQSGGLLNGSSTVPSSAPRQFGNTEGNGHTLEKKLDNGVKVVNGFSLEATSLVSDEDDWSEFDVLELTQVSRRQARPSRMTTSLVTPPRLEVACNDPFTSTEVRASPAPSAEAGPSKLPSSEEESQACSFCGNIYHISSLPTHVEACQAAQISAATGSHAPTTGSKRLTAFVYSEDIAIRPKLSRSPLKTSTANYNTSARTKPREDISQADQLEALLFGQPTIKARQLQNSPVYKDKGKGRDTDGFEDCLTSPDVPLRRSRPASSKAKTGSKHAADADTLELDDEGNTSQMDGNRRLAQTAHKRSRPIRAPDPQPSTPTGFEHDDEDLGSSPPAGSIFIAKLPKNVQRGYFRLIGLDDTGEIATTSANRLIQKRAPLPTRAPAPWFARNRGHGRTGPSKSSRRGRTRGKKK